MLGNSARMIFLPIENTLWSIFQRQQHVKHARSVRSAMKLWSILIAARTQNCNW